MSLGFILVAILIAIFAPLIAPDKTPDANDQVLELANKNPGFKVTMLLVRKNRDEPPSNIFSRIANGRENPCKMVPITSFKLVDSEIVAALYKGDFLPPVEQRFQLADIAFPLSVDMPEVKMEGDSVRYTLYDGTQAAVNLSQLQELIEQQHIQTRTYWLGTDNYGRDILSRLLFGVRVSVSVGFVAVLIALTIGVTLGSIAGYFRGFLDNSIMWLINVIWAVPTILLAMALTFALDTRMDRFWVIYIAVGLSMWVEVARIVRGQVMSVREMEYVQAARGLGYSHARIIFRHILPNIIGPIMVIAAADFASAILIEAGLSLVGIGVRPPMPSWGVMLNEHHNYLFIPEKAFLALAPGIAIMILVLAFNLLGNGLRDAFDVKGKLQ
jgi:peptide/nickel transport system permease protein